MSERASVSVSTLCRSSNHCWPSVIDTNHNEKIPQHRASCERSLTAKGAYDEECNVLDRVGSSTGGQSVRGGKFLANVARDR